MNKGRILLYGIAIGAAVMPSLALAKSKQITVPRGKPSAVLAIAIYGSNCEIYPVKNVRIASGPAHGAVEIIQVPTKLSEKSGVCKGTALKLPAVVYKPAGAFTGVDHVTVTWMRPTHTDNVDMTPEEMNIEITVK